MSRQVMSNLEIEELKIVTKSSYGIQFSLGNLLVYYYYYYYFVRHLKNIQKSYFIK